MLEYFISSVFQVQFVDNEYYGDTFAYVFNMWNSCVGVILITSAILIMFNERFEDLETGSIKEYIGALYEDIRIKAGFSLWFYPFFILRRLIFAYVVLVLN